MHLTPVPSSPQITLSIVVQLSKCYCCCWYWLCGSTVFFNPHSGSHHLELFTVWTGCKPIFCGEDLYVDCRFQKLSAVFSSVAVMIQQIGFGSLWIKKKIVKKMMHLWCMRCIWRNIRMEKYKNAVIFFTVESCFDIVELLYKWNESIWVSGILHLVHSKLTFMRMVSIKHLCISDRCWTQCLMGKRPKKWEKDVFNEVFELLLHDPFLWGFCELLQQFARY